MRRFVFFRFTAEVAVYRVGKAGMLIVVTINTQQLPVAAIGGIIVMIVVAVVNGQLLQVFCIELARAATAYPGIHF